MNIQNVAALAHQLQVLGFQDTGSLLLKRICFRPNNFFLLQRINKEKEMLLFSIFFERLQKTDNYELRYYDVTLQKENDISALSVDGINTAELEKQMTTIDWKKAFNIDEKKLWNPDDKSTWETELKISGIIDSLSILENSEQGKVISTLLKQTFWDGTLFYQVVGAIPLIRNKADVSQRFYFSEEGVGITVDEAYRFLQNKWMEKKFQLKRKQVYSEVETNDDAKDTSGNGLLKKKRIAGKGKRNKVNQD
ncbi:MAG: hypothetical protein KGZ74_19125 [Chitinophagaceae bacterium]|jgi:hypothetical protein|nr:hypothetical protein [Chitinophagaceae bacterium]